MHIAAEVILLFFIGSGLDKSQKDGLSSKTNNYLGKWKTLKII